MLNRIQRQPRTLLPLALIGCLTLTSVACVTSGTFDKKVAELDKARKDAAARDREQSESIKALEKELAARTADRDRLSKQLDDATALAGELSQRLEKLGQNVEQLTSERGQLAQGLNDAKQRLEELRRQKAAAEARAATFRKLIAKLRAMIDAGTIKVTIRNGRMLLTLPNDVLFDSGKTEVKADGQAAITSVAQVLAAIDDRRFQVAGHTDNVPIKTARFPSNWELSTARAVEVTKLLVASGMRPGVVAASGYGEFDPVATNDTPEGRSANRRIEVILEPNLSDLPSLEGVLSDP
jgi:chemotaxis protein MotB